LITAIAGMGNTCREMLLKGKHCYQMFSVGPENGKQCTLMFLHLIFICFQSLLLAHVGAIEIYCVEKGESINPCTMNTDVVEWFFGDGRKMEDGSTTNMTAKKWIHAGFKASAFNHEFHNLVGNNKT